MGRWVIISLFTFPVTVIVMVGILFLLRPPAPANANGAVDPRVAQETQKAIIKKVVAHNIRIGNVTKAKRMVDSLFTVIDVLNDSIKNIHKSTETLKQKIEELKQTNEKLNKEIASWQKKYNEASGRQMEAKSIARTLSGLKPKEMSKILAHLDDEIIILIYSQMSNTGRKNIMAALPSERAAAITKKMLKN